MLSYHQDNLVKGAKVSLQLQSISFPHLKFPVFIQVGWPGGGTEEVTRWKRYSRGSCGWRKKLKRRLVFPDGNVPDITLNIQQKIGSCRQVVGCVTIPLKQWSNTMDMAKINLPYTTTFTLPVSTTKNPRDPSKELKGNYIPAVNESSITIYLNVLDVFYDIIPFDQCTRSSKESSVHLAMKGSSICYDFLCFEEIYEAMITHNLSLPQLEQLEPILFQNQPSALLLPPLEERVESFLYAVDLLKTCKIEGDTTNVDKWIVRRKIFDLLAFKRCLKKALKIMRQSTNVISVKEVASVIILE